MQKLYEIVALDIELPHESRKVAGVEYHVADLAQDDLWSAFDGADGVIHTAGVVDLTIDSAITHNAHVVGTAHVLAAARSAGVRVMVSTSSVGAVTSPFVEDTLQINLPANHIPIEHFQDGACMPFPQPCLFIALAQHLRCATGQGAAALGCVQSLLYLVDYVPFTHACCGMHRRVPFLLFLLKHKVPLRTHGLEGQRERLCRLCTAHSNDFR